MTIPLTLSRLAACFSIVLLCGGAGALAQGRAAMPRLVRTNGTAQFNVNGKPFLLLGGELGNSSASDMAYMRPMWSKFTDMHLNTVLAPVYWELMEPQEGRFEFRLVDSLLANARQYHLRLVLLWFGSWKNSMSCYAPAWIKTNQATYERATGRNGKGMEILSAFNDNNLQADIRAFTALMAHLRQADGDRHTVIMVQVENEIGMLGEAREYTPAANTAFNREVPAPLMDYLIKNKDVLVPELRSLWEKNGFAAGGSWEQVFGKSLATDEIFQAWHYAAYTNAVAEAGKRVYPLPMYVNAALNYKDNKPGEYPSAGPLPHIMDIWQAGAPAIDMLSPDFYNPRFRYYNDLYIRRNNPLFIPEIRFEPSTAAKAFYAIGHYKAMGFCPFSIESTTRSKEEPIGKSYEVLEQLAPLILQHQAGGQMDGVLLDSTYQKQELILGKYKLTVTHYYTLGWVPEAKKPGWPENGGLIIQTGEDEFIVAGTGIVVSFSLLAENAESVGILQACEGSYVNGRWRPGRRMNGDQDHQGRHIRIGAGEFGIQQVKLYRYK